MFSFGSNYISVYNVWVFTSTWSLCAANELHKTNTKCLKLISPRIFALWKRLRYLCKT